MFSGGRRASRGDRGRDPSGDRGRCARALHPRILHKTFRPHSVGLPNVRLHTELGSNNHHASGSVVRPDTNSHPRRNSLDPGKQGEHEPRAAPGASLYEFRRTLDRIQAPRLKASLQVEFSFVLS